MLTSILWYLKCLWNLQNRYYDGCIVQQIGYEERHHLSDVSELIVELVWYNSTSKMSLTLSFSVGITQN